MITLPATFPGNKANYLVDHVFGAQVAVAAEFAMLALQGSATARVYVLGFNVTNAVTYTFGRLDSDPLDGATKTALTGTGSAFVTDKQGARTAAPFEGLSLTNRAPDGARGAGVAGDDAFLPFPVPLLLQGSGDWFFVQCVTANQAINASVIWAELPVLG